MGNIKMKFVIKFNLPHLFLALTILMTLLSIIENRSKSRRMPNPNVPYGQQARHGEICQKPGDISFTQKECGPGLYCGLKPVSKYRDLGLQYHYCLKNGEQFKDYREVCHQPGRNPIMCKNPLVCRLTGKDEGGKGNGISYCLNKRMPAGEGQVCQKIQANSNTNECRTGLVCAPKLVAGGYSQEHYCQKFVNYEEVCTGRNSVRCKSPLVCRPRDEDYGMGTGFDSICQLPEIPARYLEVCKKVDPNFKPKECETGLVCAPKPVAPPKYGPNGIMEISVAGNQDHYCLKRKREVVRRRYYA